MLETSDQCPSCGEYYRDCVLPSHRKRAEQPAGPPLCDLCLEELGLRRVTDFALSAMLARHLAFLARRIGSGRPALPFWCQCADGNRGRCGGRAHVLRAGCWVCLRHARSVYRIRAFWRGHEPPRPRSKVWTRTKRRQYSLVCTNPACGKSYKTTEEESKYCSHHCSAIVNNRGRARSAESRRKTGLAVRRWYADRRAARRQRLANELSRKGSVQPSDMNVE